MLIDTHCHLNFKAFKKDIDEVIHLARKNGIGKIIIPGAKFDSSEKAVKIAQEYENCYAAVGIHPHHAQNLNTSLLYSNEVKQLNEKLHEVARNSKVVAIGEIGLDYHKYTHYPPVSDENKSLQRKLLSVQLDVARTLNLPVIFHARDSQDDLLDFIEDYVRNNRYTFKGVFHCFEGMEAHLKRVLSLGFYVGYDGNITYEGNSRLRGLVKQTPLNRVLLETDAPYLSPVPYRGQRNVPSNLILTAAKIAEIHRKKIADIAEITTRNATGLFQL